MLKIFHYALWDEHYMLAPEVPSMALTRSGFLYCGLYDHWTFRFDSEADEYTTTATILYIMLFLYLLSLVMQCI